MKKMKTLKDKEDFGMNFYKGCSSFNIKKAILGFENILDFEISSDDFNHSCNPDYEEVLQLVKKHFRNKFGDWEK